MSLIEEYTEAVGYDHRKRYAQFFTPAPIAKFMVDWVLSGAAGKAVHDPAFGLGSFFDNAPMDCEFSGSDIDSKVIDFFKNHSNRAPNSLSLVDYLLDFGGWHENIVCNPPYLRFQKFLNRDVVFKAFRERLGVRLSGYTNIASAFLVKSISELKSNGRLAYILPSEFLNCGYGNLIKEWLIKDGHLDSVIKVECERDAFSEVTTSVCIVLYDSAERRKNVAFRKVEAMDGFAEVMNTNPVNEIPLSHLDPKSKWEQFFVADEDRVRPATSLLCPLSEYGRFSRGIATGANEFFVLSKSRIAQLGLKDDSCVPCITKSQQLRGLVFTEQDFKSLADSDAPVYLFSPGQDPDASSMRYIKWGEEQGFDKRFITLHRKPWYKTESRGVSPLLLNVFSRSGYKVVRNYSSALTLTNFHCFYPNVLRRKYVDWLFLYLQSSAGRKILSLSKRQYGDSLDKFEPNDLNAALVPIPTFFDSLGETMSHDIIESVKLGEDVDDRLDAVFSTLLLSCDCGGGVTCAADYHVERKPHFEQLRLAIEKHRKYKGKAKSGPAKSEPDGKKKTVGGRGKRPKSIKARYGKHG